MADPIATVKMHCNGQWLNTKVYQRADLQPGDKISSPSHYCGKDRNQYCGVGMVWRNRRSQSINFKKRIQPKQSTAVQSTLTGKATNKNPIPILLEIFNNLFRAIAEQMGTTLTKNELFGQYQRTLRFFLRHFRSNKVN